MEGLFKQWYPSPLWLCSHHAIYYLTSHVHVFVKLLFVKYLLLKLQEHDLMNSVIETILHLITLLTFVYIQCMNPVLNNH